VSCRVRHLDAPGLRPDLLPSGRRSFRRDEDEDKNLARVGSLERGKPILLLVETLRLRCCGRCGARKTQGRERRSDIGFGHGRRGESPREVKTQERIGSNRSGNP
jgi:hypothetical protein